jgi:hypothetical protein
VTLVDRVPYEHLTARVTAGDDRAGSWTKVTADAEMDSRRKREE